MTAQTEKDKFDWGTCKSFGRYKGKRPPKCRGGKGCWACWAIYLLLHPEAA